MRFLNLLWEKIKGIPLTYRINGKNERMVIFMPEMDPVDYKALVYMNKELLKALHSA
jgi:hypothetical protein